MLYCDMKLKIKRSLETLPWSMSYTPAFDPPSMSGKQDGRQEDNALNFLGLEEVALHHTRAETNYDMGTVNF